MKLILKITVTALLAFAAWTALVFLTISEGWLRSPIAASSEPAAFMAAAEPFIAEAAPGNAALILIEGGAVEGHHFVSRGAAVDADSRFQVASLSKWLTAWGVMTLVEDGRIDLDAPVSTYLTRWQLPDGPFDEDAVTVRRLLSHTAGLGDGLGYQGFASAEEVQSLEASLTDPRDASPNARGGVSVTAEPGSGWAYSGGGYTLLQLVVEEVSGQDFATYMDEAVFAPLGMEDTGFDHAEAAQGPLADNYDAEGGVEPFRHYTAQGASALFTTADDMARFVSAQAPGVRNPVLSQQAQAQMREPLGYELGAPIWGLGTMLYAQNGEGSFVIGHDGNNEPAINTAVRIDPATGDGIVILETGAPLLATELAGEWVYWKTGKVDFLLFAMAIDTMLAWVLGGGLAILALALLWFALSLRARAQAAKR